MTDADKRMLELGRQRQIAKEHRYRMVDDGFFYDKDGALRFYDDDDIEYMDKEIYMLTEQMGVLWADPRYGLRIAA